MKIQRIALTEVFDLLTIMKVPGHKETILALFLKLPELQFLAGSYSSPSLIVLKVQNNRAGDSRSTCSLKKPTPILMLILFSHCFSPQNILAPIVS